MSEAIESPSSSLKRRTVPAPTRPVAAGESQGGQVSARPAGAAADRQYPPGLKLLSIKQVAELTGVCPRTIYYLVARGEFPGPIKIGSATRWRESTLRTWLDRKEAKGR